VASGLDREGVGAGRVGGGEGSESVP